MMIIAIVGDIHTHRKAWDAVLRDMQDYKVNTIWGLGDYLGRGPDDPLLFWEDLRFSDSQPVRDMIRFPSEHSVIGNHDLAILQEKDRLDKIRARFNDSAWAFIMGQRRQLRLTEEWETKIKPWFETQPYLLSPVNGVYLVHGVFRLNSVDNIPFDYTPRDCPHEVGLRSLQSWLQKEPEERDIRLYCAQERCEPLLLVSGNTHSQVLWQRPTTIPRDYSWPVHERGCVDFDYIQMCIRQRRSVEWEVILNPTVETPFWLNPGSVAFPRNDGGRTAWDDHYWAKYAILEWEGRGGRLLLRWVPYRN